MMKRRLRLYVLIIAGIMLMIAVSALPGPASADTKKGTCGEGMTWTLSDAGVLTIQGKGVIEAGEWPSKQVKKVVIKSGATAIADWGLSYLCMESVSIPGTVKKIGDYAFYSCAYLKSISFPSGVESIGEEAFHFCSSLEKVHLSDTVSSITWNPFLCCFAFKTITVDAKNTSFTVKDGVLYNKDMTLLKICPQDMISGSFTVPNGVETIGNCAFWQCYGLTSITLPEGLKKINHSAFHFCENLEGIDLPGTIETVTGGAFTGCSAMRKVHIAKGAKVDNNAFALCTGIEAFDAEDGTVWISSVDGVLLNARKDTLVQYPAMKKDKNYKIPDGVEHVWNESFLGCEYLETVTIPASMRSLYYGWANENRSWYYGFHKGEFIDCIKLKKILVDDENPVYSDVNGVMFSKDQTELVRYPTGRKGDYTIPSGTEIIGEYAFYSCKGLTSVRIPVSVTDIQQRAFGSCSETLEVYYEGTKNEWAALTDRETFSNGYGSWDYNNGLNDAVIHCLEPTVFLPENTERIEEKAFANVDHLVIQIPDSVTYIAEDAFSADAVVFCSEGSYAEEQCLKLGLRVITDE